MTIEVLLRDPVMLVLKDQRYPYLEYRFEDPVERMLEQDLLGFIRHKHWQSVVYKPAIVDLPTPPFADDTAITFLTSLIFRFSGKPRCMRGILPVRGNPCNFN